MVLRQKSVAAAGFYPMNARSVQNKAGALQNHKA
jgi:hypothetical protein